MKKSTKIIIAVVSVLVVAGATVATLFLTGVLGAKKPKKGFYEYLEKAVAFDSDQNIGEYMDKIKKAQTEPSASKVKLSMDVELEGQLSKYKDIAKLLNNVEMSLDTKTDPKKNLSTSEMSLSYDGENLGTFEILTSDKEVGIKIEDIYDKYLTISLDDMVDMIEDMGMDLDMSSITESVDTEALMNLLDISDSEISRIANRYKDVLKDTIPEDNYSREKEEITVNGKNIKATAYSVSISQKDLINLAKAIIKSLADDDQTLDLLADKLEVVAEITGEKNLKLSKSEMKQYLNMAGASFDSILSSSIPAMQFTIKVYEYKNDAVRVAVDVSGVSICIDDIKDGDTEVMEVTLNALGEEMKILRIEQTEKGDGKYNTKMSMSIEGYEFEMNIDSEETDSKIKESGTVSIKIPNVISAKLNLSGETEYTSVNIDKISSSNSVEISSMKEKEMTELMMGLLDYVDDKMDTIEEIAGLLGYADEVKDFSKAMKSLQSSSSTTTKTDEDDTLDDETENDSDEDESDEDEDEVA